MALHESAAIEKLKDQLSRATEMRKRKGERLQSRREMELHDKLQALRNKA